MARRGQAWRGEAGLGKAWQGKVLIIIMPFIKAEARNDKAKETKD